MAFSQRVIINGKELHFSQILVNDYFLKCNSNTVVWKQISETCVGA